MASFVENKPVNPKLRYDQIAKVLGCSSSTLKRYENDIMMLSPDKVLPNGHKRRPKTSNEDLNRPQMNSKDLKRLNSLNPTQMQTLMSTAQPIGKTN